MKTMPNFSVERMAAGGACLQIRALGVRRHRAPRRWAVEHFSRTPVKYEYEDYRTFPTACVLSVLHWAD